MYKSLEELPEEQKCERRCGGAITLKHKSTNQALYFCDKCKKQFEYRVNKETSWWDLWQDISRTYTNVERVYATRIDCKPALREAA